MNTTHTSTKAQIIDAACELVDSQAETIQALKERQTILVTLCVVLGALLLLHP
jgi:hypothetical protein